MPNDEGSGEEFELGGSEPEVLAKKRKGGAGTQKRELLEFAERIYALYPKKVGKQAALKAIVRVLERGDVPREDLVIAVRNYGKAVERWPEDERQYVPNPATWINRGSYDDNPEEWLRKCRLPAVDGAASKPVVVEPEWDWRGLHRSLWPEALLPDRWSELAQSARYELRQEWVKKNEGGRAG